LAAAKDIASALGHLHAANITHKRLVLNSAILCQEENQFKLLGSSYLQRLFDMNRSVPFMMETKTSAVIPEAW